MSCDLTTLFAFDFHVCFANQWYFRDGKKLSFLCFCWQKLVTLFLNLSYVYIVSKRMKKTGFRDPYTDKMEKPSILMACYHSSNASFYS